MKKTLVIISIVIVLLCAGCSAQTQVRLNDDYTVGNLPSDMSYSAEGLPNIITISTESDGDILVSYIDNDGNIIVQMYGCDFISMNCSSLHKQGKYIFTLPSNY